MNQAERDAFDALLVTVKALTRSLKTMVEAMERYRVTLDAMTTKLREAEDAERARAPSVRAGATEDQR